MAAVSVDARESAAARKSVLLVEDDADLRQVIEDLIASVGCHVVPTRNGVEAQKWLRSADALPGVIILDLMMPYMTGWELADWMAADERYKAVPLVVITAFTNPANVPKHAVRVMLKPLDGDDVLEIVRRYCL
ncbi:MAG TPA: response regulator [Planctomycetota bacterium]|nr:response regulator [Planctomycetota bacterium]